LLEKVERISVLDNRFIARLIEFGLDRDDFVLFGSAPLLAYGLREDIRDLDVVTRGHTWRHVSARGIRGVGEISGDPVVHFWGGRIQFSRGWISPAWDSDELIDSAEVIENLRFARLTDVLAYKQVLGRPKDIVDIQRILTMVEPLTQVPNQPGHGLDTLSVRLAEVGQRESPSPSQAVDIRRELAAVRPVHQPEGGSLRRHEVAGAHNQQVSAPGPRRSHMCGRSQSPPPSLATPWRV
jgi:hypothetical protein